MCELPWQQFANDGRICRGENKKSTCKQNRTKCIKGNNWCAHIASSTSNMLHSTDKTNCILRAIFQSAKSPADGALKTRRSRFPSNLITHCVVHIPVQCAGQQWRNRGEWSRKGSKFANGRRTTRNAKKVGPERVSEWKIKESATSIVALCLLCDRRK